MLKNLAGVIAYNRKFRSKISDKSDSLGTFSCEPHEQNFDFSDFKRLIVLWMEFRAQNIKAFHNLFSDVKRLKLTKNVQPGDRK